jgi:hypothetical protein
MRPAQKLGSLLFTPRHRRLALIVLCALSAVQQDIFFDAFMASLNKMGPVAVQLAAYNLRQLFTVVGQFGPAEAARKQDLLDDADEQLCADLMRRMEEEKQKAVQEQERAVRQQQQEQEQQQQQEAGKEAVSGSDSGAPRQPTPHHPHVQQQQQQQQQHPAHPLAAAVKQDSSTSIPEQQQQQKKKKKKQLQPQRQGSFHTAPLDRTGSSVGDRATPPGSALPIQRGSSLTYDQPAHAAASLQPQQQPQHMLMQRHIVEHQTQLLQQQQPSAMPSRHSHPQMPGVLQQHIGGAGHMSHPPHAVLGFQQQHHQQQHQHEQQGNPP